LFVEISLYMSCHGNTFLFLPAQLQKLVKLTSWF